MTRRRIFGLLLRNIMILLCVGGLIYFAYFRVVEVGTWNAILQGTDYGNYPFSFYLMKRWSGVFGGGETWPPIHVTNVRMDKDRLRFHMETQLGGFDLDGEIRGHRIEGAWAAHTGQRGRWRAWQHFKRSREFPSTADRLEGFDLLCEMMQEIYPFFELKGIDWPALRAKYRAQVAAAPDPQTYAARLGEMLATLKDDHTRIESDVGNVYAPGLWLRAFSNRLFVTSVDKTSDAYKEGFTPGMEILAVDGMSLERAAETVAERFFHYIPPRDGPMYRAIYANLLAGSLNSTVSVETRAGGGLPRAVTLKRSRSITQPPNAEAPAHEADSGQEGFGYIKLPGFSERANAVQEFDQFLDAHKTAKGLILDLRGNGGGTALVSDPILGRLIERRLCAQLGYWRASAPGQPWGMRSLLHCAQPRGPWQYLGPVVVLVDRDTYSAAESFILMLKSGRPVVLIGETTGGGASNIMGYSLPGMIRLWFSTLDAKLREGESLESRGIDPDIHIASTIETYRSNAALLRAIEYLKTVTRPEGNLLTHRPATDGTWTGAWDGWITQSKSVSFPFSLQIEEHGGQLRVEAPFSYLVTSVQTSQDSIKLDLAIPLVSLNLKGTIKGDHIQGSWSSRDFPYIRGRWRLDRYR